MSAVLKKTVNLVSGQVGSGETAVDAGLAAQEAAVAAAEAVAADAAAAVAAEAATTAEAMVIAASAAAARAAVRARSTAQAATDVAAQAATDIAGEAAVIAQAMVSAATTAADRATVAAGQAAAEDGPAQAAAAVAGLAATADATAQAMVAAASAAAATAAVRARVTAFTAADVAAQAATDVAGEAAATAAAMVLAATAAAAVVAGRSPARPGPADGDAQDAAAATAQAMVVAATAAAAQAAVRARRTAQAASDSAMQAATDVAGEAAATAEAMVTAATAAAAEAAAVASQTTPWSSPAEAAGSLAAVAAVAAATAEATVIAATAAAAKVAARARHTAQAADDIATQAADDIAVEAAATAEAMVIAATAAAAASAVRARNTATRRPSSAAEHDRPAAAAADARPLVERAPPARPRSATEPPPTEGHVIEAAFDQGPAALLIVSLADGRPAEFVTVNQALTLLTGYPRTHLLSLGFAALEHPEQCVLDRGDVPVAPSRRDEQLRRWVHADGHAMWVRVRTAALTGPGAPTGQLVCHVEDVTAQLDDEAALRGSEKRFRQAFSGAPQAAMLVELDSDRPGRLSAANQAACEMLGRSDTEMRWLDLASITHLVDRPVMRELVQRLASGEVSRYDGEHRYHHADGKIGYFGLTLRVVRDREGRPVQALAFLRDDAFHPVARRLLERAEALGVDTVEQAARILERVVGDLGGTCVPARLAHGDALGIDISLGAGEPLLPVAPAGSKARETLERDLPRLVTDLWAALERSATAP